MEAYVILGEDNSPRSVHLVMEDAVTEAALSDATTLVTVPLRHRVLIGLENGQPTNAGIAPLNNGPCPLLSVKGRGGAAKE